MITAKIDGKDRPLRLGMMAVSAVNAKYGSLSEIMDVMHGEDKMKSEEAVFFFAYHMMVNGLAMTDEEPDIPSPKRMWAMCKPLEYFPLFDSVCKAIKEATGVTVEAEDANPKNADTTQDK